MKRLDVRLGVMALAIGSLVACGGGSSNDAGRNPFPSGGTGATTGSTAPSVKMDMVISNTTVTAANPVTVTVTLSPVNGGIVAGQVVKFSSIGGLGAFSAGSALTDSTGKATVTMYPAAGVVSGADVVFASVSGVSSSASAQKGFQINATQAALSLTSDLAGGSLSPYGQTNLVASISGVASGAPVTLTINSTCVAAGKAKILPATVTTNAATASFVYKDTGGCGSLTGKDTVTVQATGSAASSVLDVVLTSPAANSLTFSKAVPDTIYLKGSGLAESAQVSFIVNDQAGNPLPGQTVLLSPTTNVGGLTLDGGTTPVAKTSDSNGLVSVIVNSGTVPTPVRIRATLGSITTVSSSLSVAVGLPSQANFSLSQNTINIEGGSYDGTTNTYTVIASDRLANPVAPDTAVNFVAEGGQIQPQLRVVKRSDGLSAVTANFQSSEPRPKDGRITILAYALGEQSFLDANGNNVYDSGEAFQDTGNVFLSHAGSAVYTAGQDQLYVLDTLGNKACPTPDSPTNLPGNVSPTTDPHGILKTDWSIPSVANTCSQTWRSGIYVRRAIETVLSNSQARPVWYDNYGLDYSSAENPTNKCSTLAIVDAINRGTGQLHQGQYYRLGWGETVYTGSATGTLYFATADTNDNRLNPMPAGTTISAKATDGVKVSTGGSPVPSTSEPSVGAVSYTLDGVTSGVITLTFTTPNKVSTSYAFGVTSVGAGGHSCTP